MTNAHTPGPWTLRPYNNGAYIYDSNGGEVTFADSLELARLVAAAPELLAAVQNVLDAGDYPNSDHEICDLINWEMLRAAIAKAEGSNNETGN